MKIETIGTGIVMQDTATKMMSDVIPTQDGKVRISKWDGLDESDPNHKTYEVSERLVLAAINECKTHRLCWTLEEAKEWR